MLAFKKRRDTRTLGIALGLFGASLTIQAVPRLLQRWAKLIEANEDVWFEPIGAVYLLSLAIALVRGQPART